MEKNKASILLLVLSIVFITLGRTFLPILTFIGIAPLLVLLTLDHKFKYKSFDFLVLTGLVISHTICGLLDGQSIWLSLTYGTAVWVSTVIYLFTNKHSRNKIGMLTMVIYWMAIEYALLKISPAFAFLLIGTAFENSSMIPWSAYSGITGVSCWVLIANILLYISLFKHGGILNGQVRWLSICYSIILIALPVIISFFITFDQQPLTGEVVYNLYSNKEVSVFPYANNGEVFGRTSAWVSVLILIYAFVKREVK